MRNQIKKERTDDKRQLMLELKKREERKRILRHGVTTPRNAQLPEISTYTPARDSFHRLFSASNSSLGQSSSVSRAGFLPKINDNMDTPRKSESGRKLRSRSIPVIPAEKPKTPLYSHSMSTTHTINNDTNDIETQIGRVSRIQIYDNNSPTNAPSMSREVTETKIIVSEILSE